MGMTRKSALTVIAVLSLLILLAATACKGAEGPQGPTGPKGEPGAGGSSSGTVSGTVTNSLTTKAVADVVITTEPVIAGVTIKTDSAGKYSASLPIGTYTLTFKKDSFTAGTQTATLVAGQTATKDVALKPTSAVAVNAGADQTGAPGGSATLKATVEPLDGSTVTGYLWTQTAGVAAKIDNANTESATITLGNAAAYKAALIEGLKPLDRFTVQGINPHTLEEAEAATFKVAVTTSSGSYSDSVVVSAHLHYVVSTGIANVPTGLPVLLNGKKQDAYSWSLAAATGSTATLTDSSDRNPSFTPDVAGKYTLTESNSKATIEVYAGTWAGVITGQDAKGQPLAANCTACHNGTIAPDKFTAWKASGHAEIFSVNVNTRAPYAETCYTCHTVGFNKEVANGGIDEASDYAVFLQASLNYKPSPDNWTSMLATYPKTAQLANIQCENCHGPNNASTLHLNGTVDAARVSLSADVCATCHGEPPSHGRYQQWAESKHGDFTLAISRGTSASCTRCHTGQGFLLWLEQGDLTKPIQGAKGNATAAELAALGLTAETVVPQTCAVCHEPHKLGTKTDKANDVVLRIEGDTSMLPAGFKAVNVGNGALCITCHNTRNAAHNDTTGNPPSYSAPHTAAQGDVLMGENAYFVAESQRSPHSYIENTCTYCHMQLSPPPAEYSRPGRGTNHSFEASTDICSQCHSATLQAEALEAGTEAKLHKLGEKMAAYLLGKIPAKVTVKDYTPHQYGGKSYDVKSDNMVVDKANITLIEPTEPHGQQGFFITFKTPVKFTYKPANEEAHTVDVTVAEIQLGDFTTDGTAKLIPLTDPLVKAGWNYFLIEGDGSEGIHNPAFVNAVLDATIAALK